MIIPFVTIVKYGIKDGFQLTWESRQSHRDSQRVRCRRLGRKIWERIGQNHILPGSK